MSETLRERQPYVVEIYESDDIPGDLVFSFVGKRLMQSLHPGEPAKRVPEYKVLVRMNGDDISFDWSQTLDDPGAAKPEIEREATQRVRARVRWIGLVSDLVREVEQWSRELGWATRRIDKRLDDSRIGRHQVPALLLQEDTCRILLEPVGPSAPGAEGVVDLYLMPAYDDIASLYYYEDRWNIHYMFPGVQPVATVREAKPMLLSKEALRKVLAEMRQNAA
jgi:hypothetical protein